MLETMSFSSFLFSFIMEIRVPRIEKNDKNRRSVFLSFLILETLIARIKKTLKKKEPLIFLFFLFWKLFLEFWKARSWTQLFFDFFKFLIF